MTLSQSAKRSPDGAQCARGSMFSRRSLLVGLSMLPLAPPLAALTRDAATDLVDIVVGEINAIISADTSDAAKINAFEQLFAQYADVNIIARSVLGPPARSASPAQINAFVKAFQVYMANKYGQSL